MWLHSLLASWKSGTSRRRRPQPRPARPRSFRPRLEALEDRCVPSTLNVTSNVDTSALGTLRWAVGVADASSTPDTIDILTTQPIVLTQGQLLLSASMTIEATAGMATISGGGLSRVFEVTAAHVTLNDLTITGGSATQGGAIWETATSSRTAVGLTLTDCTLSGNSATGQGGAVADTAPNSSLLVTYSTLTDNSAADAGGAIYSSAIRGLGVEDSTFTGNSTGGYGGAIYCCYTLSVSDCTFTGNSAGTAPSSGGAIYDVEPSESSIMYSSFSGNTPTSLGSDGTTPYVGLGNTGLPPGAVVPPSPYQGG
jgi:predicted outer membrane repeat protein